VTDKKTGEPIEAARVTLRRRNSAMENTILEATQHVTDAEGQYSFTIPPEQSGIDALYLEFIVAHETHLRYFGGYSFAMIKKNEQLGSRPFFEHIKLEPGEAITARIETPDGNPAANVPVKLYTSPPRRDGDPFRGSWGDVVTDAQGRFRLVAATPGEAILWLLPNDAAPQAHAVKGRGDLGTFRLEAGRVMRGSVLDARGKPLPGVWVRAYCARDDELEVDQLLSRLAVFNHVGRMVLTDEHGHFVMGPLPPRKYHVVPTDDPVGSYEWKEKPQPLPAVFVAEAVTLVGDADPEPMELRAHPHVTVALQYYDSKGEITGGSAPYLGGTFDGRPFFTKARPGSKGQFTMLAPHGLEKARLNLITNEHSALRSRVSKDAPLSNSRNVQLGTLQRDLKTIEIIRYVAPIVLIRAMDEQGAPIKDFRVAAEYVKPTEDGRFILTEGILSDISFEPQADGRYRSEQLLPDEEVKIIVTAKGYEQKQETVSLPERATKELDVILTKAKP
jgi:protocatechuate 3,4-dioxygenase beta subunit